MALFDLHPRARHMLGYGGKCLANVLFQGPGPCLRDSCHVHHLYEPSLRGYTVRTSTYLSFSLVVLVFGSSCGPSFSLFHARNGPWRRRVSAWRTSSFQCLGLSTWSSQWKGESKTKKEEKERESDPPCFGGARLEHRRRRRELNPGLLRDRQEYSPLYYDDRVA